MIYISVIKTMTSPISEYVTTYKSPDQQGDMYHCMTTFASSYNVNGETIGEFDITGSGFDNSKMVQGDVTYPMGMNIHVEDEYHGRGIARRLMRNVCEKIIEVHPNVRDEQLIYIDTDASNGFWDNVGLTYNRYFESGQMRDLTGQGYEKHITFQRLYAWACR